jgi:polyhydroxyalkanoate synthase
MADNIASPAGPAAESSFHLTSPRRADMRKSSPSTPTTQDFDREFRAQLAQMTAGLAPTAFGTAWADWAMHLALAPAKQRDLQQQLLERAQDTWAFALRAMTGEPLSPGDSLEGEADRRFHGEAWNQFPFNVYARAYQNNRALLHEAVRDVDGVTDYHGQLLEFAVRMLLDASSPSNWLASNPELLALTKAEQGQNLVRGLQHWVEDLERTIDGGAPTGVEDFEVGKSVAVTPGKVVFRNELIELIQYAPTTKDVHAEPLLIVPAWIMKYYILDLSPRNSLVKYLVDQGHTVFMISWKNPDERDRDIGMDDYVDKGFHAALDAVTAIVPGRKVQAVGYCIGGTLLAIGAAALARDRDERLASVTMFAAQVDFSEPGELAFFINPAQLAMLEATMHRKGVLESRQMGGAFAMLRAQDLIWQPFVDNYLKGERGRMIDLMAWNADGTRMPWRMHSEYLYRLYLDNELATNRLPVAGRLVRLSDIRVPMFVVGTETDHVAPWKSVYKVDNLVRSDDLTFLLTSGGHNAGIVAGPVHPKRHYRIRTRRLADPHLAPDEWVEAAAKHDGSWWPAWQRWLAAHSGARTKPPAIGAPRKGYAALEDAPGQYVRQR